MKKVTSLFKYQTEKKKTRKINKINKEANGYADEELTNKAHKQTKIVKKISK